MLTLIATIIVLGSLIFVHEFGHFLVAKLVGIKVLVFSLGFGRKVFGFTLGETDYRVSILPLGGYVKLAGESPEEELEEADEESAFVKQPLWKRFATVAAGPFFNLFFALFILMMVFVVKGVPLGLSTDIGSVKKDSPAMKAGLRSGDRVLAVNGKRVGEWAELSDLVQGAKGAEIEITVEREAKELSFLVAPKMTTYKDLAGKEQKRYLIGITALGTILYENVGVGEALVQASVYSWNITRLTVVIIKKLLVREISATNLAGPIGIAQMAGQQAKKGLVDLIFFTALLSINLGILNLLPIPIFDGGHLLFFTIEFIQRKPLSERNQAIAQRAGLVIVIMLAILVFYNDIARLVMDR